MELTKRFSFNPKEGIDNPAMVTDDTEPASNPSPRVCVLKRKEGENFGFNLNVEKGRKGHIIRQIDSQGVAERSGLRDGDCLLEVNEMFVDNMELKEVSRMIQVSGSHLCFLVLDGQVYDQAVSEGRDLKELAKINRGEGWRPPRLCHITRNDVSGLGLKILPLQGKKGKFMISPVNGGAAEKAGVRKSDRLVWINGAIASELTHSAISKMVKKSNNDVTVLVIDSESEKSYALRKLPILPSMADVDSMPYRPCRLHLALGPEGYGLLLTQGKAGAGRSEKGSVGFGFNLGCVQQKPGTFISQVTAGGPGGSSGLLQGDAVVEVNGQNVENETVEDVILCVKSGGRSLTLLVVDRRGYEWLKMNGKPITAKKKSNLCGGQKCLQCC
ncbi:NHERF family PDZ scaffold protein 4b isoform X2 [Triplophysa rosa]|uniref:NHERF family PDZ scaffold protein 4b isoform X2 n=1 Tax=Triplophysa rosa TaxID=992332 RepID=UPI002545DCE6|nr:NHERF family PDZ scaffold protein 4b isoform X2 [Triplophysa rosa]